MSEHAVWVSCLDFFRQSLPPQQFNSWIKPLVFEMDGDSVVIIAPNSFSAKYIQDRFLGDISRQIEKQLSLLPNIELQIGKKKDTSIAPPKEPSSSMVTSQHQETPVLPKEKSEPSKINPILNFDNFVTGKANQLAHAAAIQVASSLGSSYNPLFIYGGVGLGKTHLLQAIGNQVKHDNPKAKIRYVHATNYVNEWVQAVRTKRFDDFKDTYNSLDLLLIDDIQFIADKAGTQQEFFYTLNTLTDAHKQIVITCDTFPKDIAGMEARLTSRFGWGLTVAIDTPNIEMRVAILLQKYAQYKIHLDESVAFFIAKHVR